MTRSQRLWHARTFLWLPLLLAAALSYAFVTRAVHTRRLAERAAPAAKPSAGALAERRSP